MKYLITIKSHDDSTIFIVDDMTYAEYNFLKKISRLSKENSESCISPTILVEPIFN